MRDAPNKIAARPGGVGIPHLRVTSLTPAWRSSVVRLWCMKFLLLLPLVVTGCATSFRSSVQVALPARSEVPVEVFSAVTNIADRNALTLDSRESIPGKRMAFYGRPYHYYFCTVEAAPDGQFLVEFVHEARMSSRTYRRSEPEKSFLEFVITNYPTAITALNYNFDE